MTTSPTPRYAWVPSLSPRDDAGGEGLRARCVHAVAYAWGGKQADVKRDIRSASILKDGRVVFNVAGNKYRIVAWINFPYRVLYIRFIGTHERYDAIDAQTV